MHDLGRITSAVGDLVANIDDDQLTEPTPCAAYSLGDLLDHVDGLALAFARAARKEHESDAPPQAGDAANLTPDWRTRIPQRLADLAQAWRDPEAWTGQTSAGGIEMDGATTGLVATNEVVLHGWDVARASGQEFTPDDESVATARGFVAMFSGPGTEASREGLFGPELPVPAGAGPLEELLAMSGRDPRWSS